MLRLIVSLILFPFFPGAAAALYLFDRRFRPWVRICSFLAAILLSLTTLYFWQEQLSPPPSLQQSDQNEMLTFPETGEMLFFENETVYYTASGKSFHIREDCPALERSVNVQEGMLRDVLRMKKRKPCRICCAHRSEESDCPSSVS